MLGVRVADVHGGRAALECVLVDLQPQKRIGLVTALLQHGFALTRAATTEQAVRCLAAVPAPRAVLVLHDRQSVEAAPVCRAVGGRSDVAVIALVAADTGWRGCVELLGAGADDVVPIDTEPRELMARITAIHRRAGSAPDAVPAASTMHVGPMAIDATAHTVTVGGEPKFLTRKEFDVLSMLTSHAGTTVRRDQLARRVWRRDSHGLDHTLDSHITSLRAKLGVRALIKTVRGVGYRVESTAEFEE